MNENKNTNEPKISISEAREALGMIHRNYSDSDIQAIIDIMWEAAEFAYDEYVNGDQD